MLTAIFNLKTFITLAIISCAWLSTMVFAQSSGVTAFPTKTLVGDTEYQLQSPGGCADIPTNGATGEILVEVVGAHPCDLNKPWQMWEEMSFGQFRNVQHPQCSYSDSGLDCSNTPPPPPPSDDASNLDAYPIKFAVSDAEYQLQNGGGCADIPTNGATGEIYGEVVGTFPCDANKRWQLWQEVANGQFRNAQHPQCVYSNSGLDCSNTPPPPPPPPVDNESDVAAHPIKTSVGNMEYLLENTDGCADIPTNGTTGELYGEVVGTFPCDANKRWQLWQEVANGQFRNAQHPQCIYSNSGLDCSNSGSPTGVTTNTDCVLYEDGFFLLNRPLAMSVNGQPCTQETCNNPNQDYLNGVCINFVHADCYVVNGIENATGFHRGISEGGESNIHYWDSIDPITLSGLQQGQNVVQMYDAGNCTVPSGQFIINYQ